MANATSKPPFPVSSENVLRGVYNEQDQTLSISPFITAKVGYKIERTIVDSVTDDFSYYDGSTLLYTIRVIYDNATHDNVNSVERTA